MMTHRPWPRPLLGKLPLLAVVLLLIGPACNTSAQPTSRKRQPAPITRPTPPAIRRATNNRPDPRYRPPANFAELQTVAAEVARASGRVIHWRLKFGGNPGPLARISGGLDDCTIYLHPVAARTVPPNTWAFIFGHEFAHRIENLGTHARTNPTNELKADIAGARYAMAAGYRLEAFLGWVLTEPNRSSATHGSPHRRVKSIAAHFRIPQRVIQTQAQRYSKNRANP